MRDSQVDRRAALQNVVVVTQNSTSDIDTSLHGNRNPTDKLSTFPNLFLYQYFDSTFVWFFVWCFYINTKDVKDVWNNITLDI